MDIKKRFNNIAFWITLVGLFLTSTRIDPSTLTSWTLLKGALVNVFGNPYLLGCFVMALIGQFMDPSTPGVLDRK